MAASDGFAVEMAHMFTDGVAYAMGVPEAEKDWDRSSPTNFVQVSMYAVGRMMVHGIPLACKASSARRFMRNISIG